jgi:hypothetical protein
MTPVPDDVRAFLDRVQNAGRKADAETLLELIGRITGEPPRMWGPSIIGFGEYHYKYQSGREGSAPGAGFAPRKPATTIYLPDGVGAYADEATRLGTHTTGVGCLYIKHLSDVDLAVLESIIASSYRSVTAGTFPHRARDSGTPTADD